MYELVSRSISNFRQSGEKKALNSIEAVLAERAAKGTVISGATHLAQIKSLHGILEEFAESILVFLTKAETEHSPIKPSDFDAASLAVSDFSNHLHFLLEEKKSRWQAPESITLNHDGELDRLRNKLTLEIELAKAEFSSKRSFLKWAFGDLKKRVWSGALVAFGLALAWIWQTLLQQVS